jgi:hypothetical protein
MFLKNVLAQPEETSVQPKISQSWKNYVKIDGKDRSEDFSEKRPAARVDGQRAVGTAGGLLWRLGPGRRSAGGSFVGDDLAQAFDAVLGEGGDAILADAVDPKAAVFGEHT